jgi:DDE superfamily endonuclease
MAVVDANYKFIVVDVGSYGSNSDGGIWKNSKFGEKFDNKKIELPPPKCLPKTDNPEMPFVLVGDEAFQLRSNFMRPYPGRSLSNSRHIYNYRHSRARYVKQYTSASFARNRSATRPQRIGKCNSQHVFSFLTVVAQRMLSG